VNREGRINYAMRRRPGSCSRQLRFDRIGGEWYAHLFLLMPDHAHGFISFPNDANMRQVVSEWKESAARRAGVHWQRDFFDHRLRNDENFVEKAHYIRMNPVRKGLVVKPEDWPYVLPG